MFLIAFKLILAPFLIAAATLIGRRWGHGIGGWVIALPVTSGPVSLIFALQYGTAFASSAAVGTLAGLISVSTFCFVYCRLARWHHWTVSLSLAVVGFFGSTALLNSFALTLIPVFIAVLVVLTLARRFIPDPKVTSDIIAHPKWDLPVRMLTAIIFIFTVSYAAEGLGPQLSGLVTPFPIFAMILAVFAHSQRGAGVSIQTLRGILMGLYSFATFFLVVGTLVTILPIVLTYAIATAVAVGVNAFTLRFVR